VSQDGPFKPDSGKSTFLRVLAGDEPASEGTYSLPKGGRIGVLRQDRFQDDDAIILDLAMRGDPLAWGALRELEAIADGTHPDPARATELEDLLDIHDGRTLEARATEVLEGLGIPRAAQRAPLRTLSGGFKLRVLLAEVLVGGADVLLLDEPTNHLDILSIRWLERFLMAYQGCAVVISHDQRFLDNTTTHTLDVDYGTITPYVGAYSAFEVAKRAIREQKELAVGRAEDEIAKKRAWVERFGAKNTKATQAQSRLKMIERIQVEELAASSRRAPYLRFVPVRQSGRDVLVAEGLTKAYGPKKVLTELTLTVRRGERIGIIGPNGLGKSTLLKILVDHVEADAGRVAWGHEVRTGYFPQDHHEVLSEPNRTVMDTLYDTCPGENVADVRGLLGRVLFSGEDVQKKVGSLSGGEAARLVFALLVAAKPNVLLLDEPTNHLDIESIHALIEGLLAYEGTVLFVSHDRHFVSSLATRIVELTPTGPRDFPGSYAEYLARCGDDHLDADAVVLKEKRAKGESKAESAASGASWEEQKKKRNRQKELPARRDAVLLAVEVAEARKKAIEELYCSPGFFERTAKSEIAALEREQAELGPKIDALLGEWESLEAELGALGPQA
jgi:ATPase subunit of ABC transporter with duplicated ATPase domains